jgi:hypothetical protein
LNVQALDNVPSMHRPARNAPGRSQLRDVESGDLLRFTLRGAKE